MRRDVADPRAGGSAALHTTGRLGRRDQIAATLALTGIGVSISFADRFTAFCVMVRSRAASHGLRN